MIVEIASRKVELNEARIGAVNLDKYEGSVLAIVFLMHIE